MTETPRTMIEPAVLTRLGEQLGESMLRLAKHWQDDVRRLNDALSEIESLKREVNLAADRNTYLEDDLRKARERIDYLIQRNAVLEADYNRLYDSTQDAGEMLSKIGARAVETAKANTEQVVTDEGTTAPRPVPPAPRGLAAARVVRTADGNRSDLDDGLPDGPPAFLRTPMPDNEFVSRPVRSRA